MRALVTYGLHGDVAVLTMLNPPVNVLAKPLRTAFLAHRAVWPGVGMRGRGRGRGFSLVSLKRVGNNSQSN